MTKPIADFYFFQKRNKNHSVQLESDFYFSQTTSKNIRYVFKIRYIPEIDL